MAITVGSGIEDNLSLLECAFTSPVRTECDIFVMYCMQCRMSMSAVLWCMDVLSRGGI